MAETWYKVSDKPFAIESPAFDRQGNLFFVNIYEGQLLKLSPQLVLSTLYSDKSLHPAGIAIHRDGRIFLAGFLGLLDKRRKQAINDLNEP